MKTGPAIAEILKSEGVEYLFAYPVNHLIEHCAAVDIRPIIVRQERIGLHMADAMSRLTKGRKMGVFCMQSGPGSENAYGGVAQAFGESVPLLVIPAGLSAPHRPRAAATSTRRSPWRMSPSTPSRSPSAKRDRRTSCAAPSACCATAAARRCSSSCRPTSMPRTRPIRWTTSPVVATKYGPDPAAVREAAKVLVAAKRPVIYAGQGVHWAEAYDELKELAELLAIPVCTSLEGKSASTRPIRWRSARAAAPSRRPVRHFLDQSDVILGIGCSFTETNFGVSMPKGKTIIHATLDPDAHQQGRAARSTAWSATPS